MLRKLAEGLFVLFYGVVVLGFLVPGPFPHPRIKSLLILIGITTLAVTGIAFLFKPRARAAKQKAK